MEISLILIFRFWTGSGFSCSSRDRFDDLIPQDQQSGHLPQCLGDRLIAARVLDFMHQVFSAQFLQIISSLVRAGLAGNIFLHFGSQISALKSMWSHRQSHHGLQDCAHSGLVDINTPNASLPDLGRFVPILQAILRDGGNIHAAQGIQEALQDFFQPPDNLGELGQRASTVQFFGVVNAHLRAQDACAFGIHLGGDLPEVYLEDRQVIRRSLDHDFAARFFVVLATAGTLFASKDGLQAFDIQQAAGAIKGALKDLLQLTATLEQEVATVFFLIDRVIVMKVGLFLLSQIQPKAQASRVNPTLTDLRQAPYAVWRRQGVCDLRQSGRVGNLGETIAFLYIRRVYDSNLIERIPFAEDYDLEQMQEKANQRISELNELIEGKITDFARRISQKGNVKNIRKVRRNLPRKPITLEGDVFNIGSEI